MIPRKIPAKKIVIVAIDSIMLSNSDSPTVKPLLSAQPF
jgi:hypothetical protein